MLVIDMKEKNNLITLKLALEKAILLKTDIVVATTSGSTAKQLIDLAEIAGFEGNIIAVTHSFGSRKKGQNIMDNEMKESLESRGVQIVTAAHVLSGAERGISKKHNGIYPVQIIAETLRMFSQGVKVCVEISVMAMDNGKLEYGKPIIAIGGKGNGANTAVLLTPEYASNILDTRIHEIYCKPY